MPTYVYACQTCAAQFERCQSYDAAPVQNCPRCGGRARRVIQPTTVIYKARGFYVTENRRESEPVHAPAD